MKKKIKNRFLFKFKSFLNTRDDELVSRIISSLKATIISELFEKNEVYVPMLGYIYYYTENKDIPIRKNNNFQRLEKRRIKKFRIRLDRDVRKILDTKSNEEIYDIIYSILDSNNLK